MLGAVFSAFMSTVTCLGGCMCANTACMSPHTGCIAAHSASMSAYTAKLGVPIHCMHEVRDENVFICNSTVHAVCSFVFFPSLNLHRNYMSVH